jgi:putative hydrolase of the HAD superfamily
MRMDVRSGMIRHMKIRAVIFDRDNTLVYFDAAATAALEARVAAAAPMLPAGAAAAHWSAWPGPWPATVDDEPAFWQTFWAQLAARYTLTDATTTALCEIGGFYHTCFTAFPDATPCLRALRTRGLQLAVLTNFELPSIDQTLQNAGLDPTWFSALLCSASIGIYKPDPKAYLAAAAALELEPAECAFVDDLPINVAAACELDMRSILLDRAHAHTSSSFERIDNLHGLVDLLTSPE